LPEARRYIEEALPLARGLPAGNELLCTLLALGDLDRLDERNDAARACFEQCLALARLQPDLRHVVVNLLNLSALAVSRGAEREARAMLREAIELCADIGSKTLGGYSLLIASGLAAYRRESRWCAELHAAASRMLEEIGFRCEPADEAYLAPLLEGVARTLPAQELDSARASGRSLSHEEATERTRRWLDSLAATEQARSPTRTFRSAISMRALADDSSDVNVASAHTNTMPRCVGSTSNKSR
jgi:hypothetical protein